MRPSHVHGVFTALISLATGTCYYPDGTIAPDDSPCRLDKDQSACCGWGSLCMSNHMCQARGFVQDSHDPPDFYRGSCTDKAWKSDECPKYCVDPNDGGIVNAVVPIEQCSENSTLFACDSDDKVDCSSTKGLISFAQIPTGFTIIGQLESSSASSTTSSSHRTAANSETNASKKATSTSDKNTSSTSSSSFRATAGSKSTSSKKATSTSDTRSSSATVSSEGRTSASPSNSSKVGLGVGVAVGGLGAAALIAAVILLQKRRKLKRTEVPTEDGHSPRWEIDGRALQARYLIGDERSDWNNGTSKPLPETPISSPVELPG